MPRRLFYCLVAGCGFVVFLWFMFAAVAAARRAAEREQRRQEQYVHKVNGEWFQKEIERLTSGKSDFVSFFPLETLRHWSNNLRVCLRFMA